MTKQTQATPGPWRVVHDLPGNCEAVADLVNNTWVVAAAGQELGDWNADARLIAAAPAMRDVLADIGAREPHRGQLLLDTEDLVRIASVLAKLDN